MEKKTLKQRIKENPGLKQAVHRFIMHPVKTRPNWWIRLFDFIYLKRGKGSVIYRSVRKDLLLSTDSLWVNILLSKTSLV